MSRWDYDSVLYRVFCITLLAVAFTFTVILTNVFIDIDGLLYKKDKVKPKTEAHKDDVPEMMNVNFLPDDKSEDVYDDKDYQDSSDLYRSKRALETSDFLLHVKDPKLKKVLTSRLAFLLDELDENESVVLKQDINNEANKETTKNTPKIDSHIDNIKEDAKHTKFQTNNVNIIKKNVNNDLNRDTTENIKQLIKNEELIQKEERIKTQENEKTKDIRSDEMGNELLHLAMHNMVLQGIIGNMNLDNVYNKIAELVKNYEHSHDEVNKGKFATAFQELVPQKKYKRPDDEDKIHKHTVNKEVLDEAKLFKDLHREDIKNIDNIANDVTQRTKIDPKENHVMIKTIIDITALANDENNKETDKNLNVNGVIKLIYNGKMFKFKKMDDDITSNISTNISTELKRKAKEGNKNLLEIIWKNKDQKDVDKPVQTQKFYKKMLQNYLKTDVFDSSEHKKLYSKKRLKRHVKIRFDNHNSTAKPKHKKNDDELFVEIETHFDSKGAKGEKKKRLIRDLIKKIEKAIHSENDTPKKKHKHWHVKKRIQDPLSSKRAAALINKLIIPLENLAHRHSNPISKAVALQDDMPLVSDDFGQTNWHRNYMGPRFFGKAINSAEMSTVDIDYNKVMRHNGIPQRLQKPLNTDMSDEVLENSKIYDLGDMKFLMKDIDGTGFTIGFNQYTDEAPDIDTMKLFSGLEAIIQTYHQKYDQQQPSEVPVNSDTDQSNSEKLYIDDANVGNDYEKSAKSIERNPNTHKIERRSIREPHKSDHHSSEYNYILKRKFLPYNNYQEIYNNKISKESMVDNYKKEKSDSVLVVDENVLERDLKPGEILSLANLLQRRRRKRAMNRQIITNMGVMNNLNRYLNTKTMATKSIFRNKKRHKRQTGKIRIVARDTPNRRRNSEEEFFVLSDEKLIADRAVLREMELPEDEPIDKMTDLDHYDIIEPQKEVDEFEINNQPIKANEDHFDIISPYTYDLSRAFDAQSNEFSRRARHNNLMAKYPHIFLEETMKEDSFYAPIATPNGNVPYSPNVTVEITTQKAVTKIENIASPYAESLVKLLQPPHDLNNYRVSVKIRPKNTTGMSGYREVHTSINKSYNKNGLVFTSLVNVSQLSKVEKIHKNASDIDLYNKKSFNQQKNLIQSLILQHKNRIDAQLRQLLEEREKLENIYMDNTAAMSGTLIDTPFSTKLQSENIDLSGEKVTSSTEASPTIVHTAKPKTVMPVTEQIETIKPTDKTTTLKTLNKDENITSQILKKMDQNTGVLQTFLGKLIEKIDMSIKNSAPVNERKTENIESGNHKPNVTAINYDTNENKANNLPFDFEEFYKNIHKAAFKNMPRQGNFSGIPFVYAYQQPIDFVSNKNTPVASVIYHGHIHANTDAKNIEPEKKQIENYNSDITASNNNRGKVDIKYQDAKEKNQNSAIDMKKNLIETEFWKAKKGEKVIQNFKLKNKSKFFMDESGRDFKMYSPMESILGNSTKV